MEIERDSVWWFRLILEALVFVVGTPGNALIIRVYAAKKNKATPHIFIVGLASADIAVCISRIIPFMLLFSPFPNNEFICRVPVTLDSWQKYTSMLLTVAIAIDRYFGICRPHSRKFNNRRARYAVSMCFLLATVICSPFFFMYAFDPRTGICFFYVPMWFIVTQFLQMVVVFIVSLIIIVISYLKVHKTIRGMAKVRPGRNVGKFNSGNPRAYDDSSWNNSTIGPQLPEAVHPSVVNPSNGQSLAIPGPSNSPTDDENTIPTISKTTSSKTQRDQSPKFQKKVTLMLLLSTVIFVVTIAPAILVLVFYPLILPQLGRSATLRTIVNVASYINIVNHAANPFLYSFLDPRFRKECIKIFRCI